MITLLTDEGRPGLTLGFPIAGPFAVLIKDEFTPTNNQVTFVLSSSPLDPSSVNFEVNGVTYDDVDDFTILGNTVSWLDTEFQMQTTDHVVVRYT